MQASNNLADEIRALLNRCAPHEIPEHQAQLFARMFDRLRQPYPASLSAHIRMRLAEQDFQEDFDALQLSHEDRMAICREFFDAAEAYLPGSTEKLYGVVAAHVGQQGARVQ
jgi:hypothetical protein